MGKEALIIVDVQKDFCPGGSLAVREGDQVIEPINQLTDGFRARGKLVFASRDWHKPNNVAHMNDHGGWPKHCIQGSKGAEFCDGLNNKGAEIVTKGDQNLDDGYSAFEGRVADGRLLGEVLKEAGIDRIVIGGLATDYCVKATVLSALRDQKIAVTVAIDAIRAVDLQEGDGEKAIGEMKEAGAEFLTTEKVIAKYLEV